MKVTVEQLNLAELRAVTRQHDLQPSYDREAMIRNLRATPFFSRDPTDTPVFVPFSPSRRRGRGAPGGFA